MERIKKDFCENAVLIGAPFEAHHQLVALYKQGIIDYDFTDDSDLIVLRVGLRLWCDPTVNTQKSLKGSGKRYFGTWHMTQSERMNANEQSTL